MLHVLTIQPFGDFLSNGAAARATRNTPSTLTEKTRFHASTVISSKFVGATSTVVPALLISTSSRPNFFSTAANMARTPASSLTSQRHNSVLAPAASASRAVILAASSLRL